MRNIFGFEYDPKPLTAEHLMTDETAKTDIPNRQRLWTPEVPLMTAVTLRVPGRVSMNPDDERDGVKVKLQELDLATCMEAAATLIAACNRLLKEQQERAQRPTTR